MIDESPHAACVDAWMKRAAREHSPEGLLQFFEAALDKLWAGTQTTLGEVTLTAITERVLYNTAEKFPLFAALTVEPPHGIQMRELRERIASAHPAALKEGFRFMLVEFLTVLGHLTAEILTPELHAGLGCAPASRPTSPGKGKQSPAEAADDAGGSKRS